MNVLTESRLIAPHGGTLVDRTGERPDDLESLETLTLSSRELSDLDMLASGALSPLQGFMGREDYESVLESMRLASGLPWALPVCLAAVLAPAGDRVALADQAGRTYGVLDVEEVYEYDKEREAQQSFRTTDAAHPGVASMYDPPDLYVAGRVTVFDRTTPPFSELALDPADTRAAFAERGWRRVVGFQTRNPIHRAHEYLTKVALETVDGLLIHPLVGDTKSDDVPSATRVECYRVLIDGYYPDERVVLGSFPAAMRYAGPREAIWHAICRKNYGCSHFIVGRDHAGGGSLMTPILVIVFGFKPTYAVGTDILHGAVFKTFGALRHRRLGTVHARLTLWMFLGSGPMSLLGVALAGWLSHTYGDGVQSAEGYAIGAALVLGAAGLVAKTFIKRGVQPDDAPFILQRRDRILAVMIGAVFDFIVVLTSVGSGTFFGLVMVMIYPLTLAKIVGTDIFHAAALLWVAGFGHLVQGNVDLHAMAWLLLGSVPGIWISSRFTLRVPQDALRLGLAGVLALSGIKLLNVPQSSYVIAVGLGLGLTALAVLLLLQSRRSETERTDDSRPPVAGRDGD